MSGPARITDCLDRHADERPQALAVADGGLELGWRELRDAVDQAAAELASRGVRPAERVVLSAADGAGALVAALAVLRLGAVHVPADQALAPAELRGLVVDMQAAWLLEPGHSRVLGLDPAQWCLQEEAGRGLADPLPEGGSAFLRLSSGTTGQAKGVLLSHRSLAERIAAVRNHLELGAGDRVLWLLPMAYHFAVSILLYLEVGAAVVFGNHLRAGMTAAVARRQAVTFAYGSPYQVRRLASLPAGEDLPATLRRMVSTTAALDADAAAEFHARHGIWVQQALGIIEVGLPLLSGGGRGEAPGFLGPPRPPYRACILDPQGQPLGEDEPGELAFAGPGLFDAYLAPWRPRAEVLAQGWFRTGDRAQFDHLGNVRLLGRLKDLVNVGGVKVFPLEVEAVLDTHPWVQASRVRAGQDQRLGELVLAEVQLRPGRSASEVEGAPAALAQWCAQRLAALKRPAEIRVVPELPMTPSGKVRR